MQIPSRVATLAVAPFAAIDEVRDKVRDKGLGDAPRRSATMNLMSPPM